MENRIKDYSIKGNTIALPRITGIEDIRLIYNETQKVLICSTAKKDNLSGLGVFVTDAISKTTTIRVPTSICVLNEDDQLTIKCDYGDDLSSVESKVDDGVNTLSTKIDNIKLPEIDTTELAKENTVNGIKDFLAHLALSSRSVDGVYSVSDGISIAHLYGNQSECLAVTEIKDKDTGWIANKGNFLSTLISLFPNCRYFELGCSDVTTSIYTFSQDILPETTIVFRDLQTLKDIVYYGNNNQLCNANVTIHVYGLKTSSQTANDYHSFHVPKVLFHDYERGSIRIGGTGSYSNTHQSYIYLGCKGDKTDTITLVCNSKAINTILNDVEIRNEACQNIRILYCNGLTEENMINHILKRLKQDEEMCGSGVTITLGATNLAKLTSEEAVALLDSLTNTYGYTFA